MPISEEGLSRQIASALESRGLNFQENVVVGHTTGDFYVVASSGSSLVLNVKTWQPTRSNQERASKQASLFKSASGADNAFVVLTGLTKNKPEQGLVSLERFDEFLDKYIATLYKSSLTAPPQVQPKPGKFVFAAMPFAPKYDDTFFVAMQPAALEAGAECVRVDHAQFTGDVVAEIRRLINKSVAAVVDLSDSRPNVLYEMGLAEALGHPIIQISSTGSANLPFDVRNNKTIDYSIGQTAKLKTKLLSAFTAIIT